MEQILKAKELPPEQVIDNAYEHAGIDSLLNRYAHGRLPEEQVEPVLFGFVDDVAEYAFNGGEIDAGTIRYSFGKLSEGYERIIQERTKAGFFGKVLDRAILGAAKPKTITEDLSQHCWSEYKSDDFGGDLGEKEKLKLHVSKCVELSWGWFDQYLFETSKFPCELEEPVGKLTDKQASRNYIEDRMPGSLREKGVGSEPAPLRND